MPYAAQAVGDTGREGEFAGLLNDWAVGAFDYYAFVVVAFLLGFQYHGACKQEACADDVFYLVIHEALGMNDYNSMVISSMSLLLLAFSSMAAMAASFCFAMLTRSAPS